MTDEPERPKAKRKTPLGQSIGGVLFGFEQQVWRTMPPPHELVHHARPDAPVPAGDGGFLMIELPGSDPDDAAPAPDDAVPAPDDAAGSPAPAGVEGVAVGPGRPTPPSSSASSSSASSSASAAPSAGPEVTLADLDPEIVFAVRVVQPMEDTDVGRLVDRWYPELGRRLAEAGLEIAGPPYVRYRDFGGETADLELGFPVPGEAAGAWQPIQEELGPDEPGLTVLPGGRAAVADHVGPYAELHRTWRALEAWIATGDLAVAGAPWESYTDNPDLVEPAALRTRVVMPVHG